MEDLLTKFNRLKQTVKETTILEYTEEEWGQKHFIFTDPAGTFVDVVEQS